jgi:hypothetical protein
MPNLSIDQVNLSAIFSFIVVVFEAGELEFSEKIYEKSVFSKSEITSEDFQRVREKLREVYPETYERTYGWRGKMHWWVLS